MRRLLPLVAGICLLAVPGVSALAQAPGSPAASTPTPLSTPAPLGAAEPSATPDPLAGAWDVLSFDAWGDGLLPPRAGTTLTAVFLPAGRLEGETGCGAYFGGYVLDGDRLGLRVISKGSDPCDVATTEEAVGFSVALEAVVGWRAAADSVELLDDAGAVRLVLARIEDLGLTGGWRAERYARANGEPTEPLPDRPIELTFAPDGTLQGSSGCRLLEGQYTGDRDQVVVALVETVGLPCEGDAQRQERRLLRILDQVVFWQRERDRLVLADGSSAPLLELRSADTAAGG